MAKDYEFFSLFAFQALLMVSVALFSMYGEADFADLGEPSGPYSVGAKRLFTDKIGQHMVVFYPIKRREIIEDQKLDYRLFNKDSEVWSAKAFHWIKNLGPAIKEDFTPDQISLDHIKVDVCKDAAYDLDEKKLVPIIFKHGLSGNNMAYSAYMREMASHGFIVFAPESIGRDACYTERRSGEKICMDMSKVCYDKAARKEQHQLRLSCMTALLEELHKNEYLQRELDFPAGVSIDLGSLILAGHSFGAVTALGVANDDARIKAVLTMDPWLWALEDEIKTKSLKLEKVPLQSLETEFYRDHSANLGRICEQFYSDNNTLKDFEHITLLGCGHFDQADVSILMPIETRLLGFRDGMGPLCWSIESHHSKYLQNCWLQLQFLKKFDLCPLADVKKVSALLENSGHKRNYCKTLQ